MSVIDGSTASPVSSVRWMSSPEPIWSRELVLISGKGGVGKTNLTAALGRMAQKAGRRTLIAEVTPDLLNSSPLLSFFGHARPKTEEPFRIDSNLFGVRIAPQSGHRLFLRQALKVRLLVDTAMKSAALTRFLMAAPTFPEIGVLFQIVHFLRQGRFDHIIIDLPATGHALALASLPRVVHRIVPTGLIGDAIKEGLDCLTSKDRCWAVIPTLPESMPVTETSELITSLEECGITVGAAVLNKVPTSPLMPSDRAQIQKWQGEHPRTNFLGARELVRLDRAHLAREMFHDILPPSIPKFEIPEILAETDEARIAQMADRLKSPITAGLVAPAVTNSIPLEDQPNSQESDLKRPS